ncbi:N-acetylglucosamine-6-phosphate deacetylase [Paracidobacterium acidisoli]|uniref:N-acetylglucosamine-6-phosphate deacetylase n=1 Tax=Paracidobacterium acidisoli TaxID=2303751 RepID=A0A372IRL7_9BACT|nr:N-acetylglucosamine-6-phosphate deacetylase [Paracidobacterium acidisoli]MBT9330510.1 N-acetylglucosamine-6-phosphate deacetylase [Paracidobacterium acidisoli]
MRTVVTADRFLSPAANGKEERVERPVVIIEDGHILSTASQSSSSLPAGEHLHFEGCTLIPAFFDVHIHGSDGFDVMNATDASLGGIGRFLARHGVGSYFATTVTAPVDSTLKSLSGLAKRMRQETGGARAVGIHIEGPFLSPHKKGAHPAHLLQPPTVALFDRMWQAAEGQIRLMTIAPELPGALEVIARAAGLGVRVSLGHSDARLEEARQGVGAGAITATHTFNAMRAFDHREPGLIGEVLSNDALFAELICDGLHVDPAAVEIFWKSKGRDRAMLITDAMSATGKPDGNYKLGELDVRVKNGVCLIGENTLAGSTLTLDRAVRNFTAFTGASLEEMLPVTGRNPARMTGLEGEIGTLAPGRRADITVLSAKNEVVETLVLGERCSKA